MNKEYNIDELWDEYFDNRNSKKEHSIRLKLFKKYEKLGKHIAKKFARKYHYLEYDDLCQEASIIIWNLIPKFDKTVDKKFSSYAYSSVDFSLISIISSS